MTKFILSLTLVFSIVSSMANLHAESPTPTNLSEKRVAAKDFLEKITQKKSMVALLTAAALTGLAAVSILTVKGIQAYQLRKAIKDDNKDNKDYTQKSTKVVTYLEGSNNTPDIEALRDGIFGQLTIRGAIEST